MTCSRDDAPSTVDAVVIGAGFGGLGAALSLAERGASVVLLEALTYPGGCASTFSRDGYKFEAGATLFSGLGPGQLFERWIREYGLDVTVDWLDPVVEVRAPSLRLAVPRDRERFVERFLALPGAPRRDLLRFLERQRRVADVLWGLLEHPELLPPFRLPALGRHALRAADYARLLPYLGRPLGAVLEDHGLERFEPRRLYLDALCQITVQCPLGEAEALLAMGTMDYYFRGTGHVRGGIGRLATALLSAVREAGGTVSMANPARALERAPHGWRVRTRRFDVETPLVIANVLPQNLSDFWPSPVLDGLYLVGDSLFPGQSTLAAALGGRKLAEHLAA